MNGITVLVVAESLALAQDLNIAFRRRPTITVLGPAFDVAAARDLLVDGTADVVVVDMERGDGLAVEVIASLRAVAPVPVLAWANDASTETAALVLAVGGCGMLPHDADAGRLADVIGWAASGEIALPDAYLASVIDHLHATRTEREGGKISCLTPREREVLVLLSEGRPPGEIAAVLMVSGSTIQAHMKAVFTKLGVHSQIEAVRIAWRSGLGVPVSA